jgi:hypothetical protein
MSESTEPNWLNRSFLERALKSGADGSRVTVTSSDVERATAAGDNYASDIYRVNVHLIRNGQPETMSLIIKSEPPEEEMHKVRKHCVLLLYAFPLYSASSAIHYLPCVS